MSFLPILAQKCISQRNRTADARRGFTLVELIVVLVILAILAALLIPALSGYIDKANERAIITETRQAVMATQTLASESYAQGEAEPTQQQIEDLAEVPGQVYDRLIEQGKVTHLAYEHDGLNCIYCSVTRNGQPCSQCWAKQTYTVSKDEVSFYAYNLMSRVNDLCTTDKTGVWTGGNTKLDQYFNTADRVIDSNAIYNATSRPWAGKIREQLEAAGFDPTQGSWLLLSNTKVQNNRYILYYSPTKIDASMKGNTIDVTTYDPNTGKRVSGTAKVGVKNENNTTDEYAIIDYTTFAAAN